ncbi:MAG: oligopeptide transporter, OPT family, partial [Acidobacteriota bacterium]
WDELHYWESTAIMLIGGLLGVLFIVILRRTLVVEADLPFPESVAAAEIVKAGQGGQTGAAYLFGAMGLAGLWEFFKNPNGIPLVQSITQQFIDLGRSTVTVLQTQIQHRGGLLLQTPDANPILVGVGFIVGTRISAILFAGAVLGWLLFVPLAIFLNPALMESAGGNLVGLANSVWTNQIRPLAVGTMIVAAFYTLYNLRTALITGIGRAFKDIGASGKDGAARERTDIDLHFKKILLAVGVMAIPTFFLYWMFSQSLAGAIMLTVVMIVLGFLFAAVAGYLVGMIGSSNNPISGLTLSALLISAILMVLIGVTGISGVAAVLGVAGIVCCAAGVAGDMMQDLKVGHILGGTPWKMEVGELIGVVIAALAMTPILRLYHEVYTIGSATLPAPQAGLMALMSKSIISGEAAWPLIIVGMFLALGLILIKSPSPMLIAVGMYLPFSSTCAIFVGGIIKWLFDRRASKMKASDEERKRGKNIGILISSGMIAGGSLMAALLALVTLSPIVFPTATPNFWLSLIIYPVLLYLLVWLPSQKMKAGG